MSGVKIPELIETWRIARAIGWSTNKTIVFFRDAGLSEHIVGRREALVVREDLEATMPIVYRIFVKAYESGDLASRRGRRSRERKNT